MVAKKENVQIRKCQIHNKHFCEEHSHWQCGSHPIPSSPPASVSTPTALAASAKRPPPKRARCLGEQMGWLHKTAPFKKKRSAPILGDQTRRGFICPSWCRILLINSIGFRFSLCWKTPNWPIWEGSGVCKRFIKSLLLAWRDWS